MRKVLDLGELHKQLRQTEEHEPHCDEELNPYLLDTVLPQLEGEEPIRLEQIDFDQFDEEDPFTILDYYYWRENLCNTMRHINRRISDILPSCVKTRAFL